MALFLAIARGDEPVSYDPPPMMDQMDVPPMSEYVPSDDYYPKDFRLLDCWQCFKAQGKVCKDKDYTSLYGHVLTTNPGRIFCCKQDYNEEYC